MSDLHLLWAAVLTLCVELLHQRVVKLHLKIIDMVLCAVGPSRMRGCERAAGASHLQR